VKKKSHKLLSVWVMSAKMALGGIIDSLQQQVVCFSWPTNRRDASNGKSIGRKIFRGEEEGATEKKT